MNFKSGRVDGLEGINTEICEQVNSYLQCIKFTGSHLSREHFMFFTQNKEVQPDESSSCSISVVKYLYKCILFQLRSLLENGVVVLSKLTQLLL